MKEGVDARGEPIADPAAAAREMVESRVPGRTGTYGWTVREGFAREMQGTRSGGRRVAGPEGAPGSQGQRSREGID